MSICQLLKEGRDGFARGDLRARASLASFLSVALGKAGAFGAIGQGSFFFAQSSLSFSSSLVLLLLLSLLLALPEGSCSFPHSFRSVLMKAGS